MNRHERRKQKRSQATSTFHKNLLKAIQLHTNKEYELANKLYNELLSIQPNNYDVLRHLGILFQDQGNYEMAYDFFLRSIEVNPKGFEALNNLGTIHAKNKNYELAIKCFNRSLEINEKYIPTINNLASIYHKINYPRQALEFSSRALAIQPENPFTKNQHAKALVINNRPKEAIEILKELNSTFDDNDDYKFNLSSAYREIGEFEKANKITVAGFRKNYKTLPYLTSYVADKRNKLTAEHLNYYDNQLNDNMVNGDDKVIIAHSLFGYFKNQKNFEKAGQYLTRGNSIQYSIKDFNFDFERDFFKKIKKIFSQKREFKVDIFESKNIPIFICGMPRSGTTLCEQILSSHSKVVGAGELSYLAETSGINKIISPSVSEIDEFESTINNIEALKKVRNNYLDYLKKHNSNNSLYICDKMPHNFILIGLIKLILPEAKIIYCKRDPIDNCFSLYSHKFMEMSHQYSYDQVTLAKYYYLHKELMDFWIKMFGDKIFILDNEELVDDQENVSKKLIQFCDLNWEKQCLQFHKNKRQVRTASIEQVRKPINKKSIGAWKNYSPYLTELVNELTNHR
jgi:tetratricopeptide (TPR) repeat protein